MWPFKPKTQPELSERVDELSATVTGLLKRLDEIEVEWEGWYDKFRTLHSRLAKRQQREAEGADSAKANGNQPINPAAARILNPYGRG